MKRNSLFLFFFFFSLALIAQNYTISGYVTDGKNGETLISSSLFESATRKGTVTNAYGFYSLTVAKGDIDLVYSYIGYAPQHRKFNLTKDTTINIKLGESVELNEITVLGNRKELGVHGSQMSAIDIPIAQIKAVPCLFGETDVIKALQLLPGVKAGTEGSAGMYVRGGGPDENLLLLDGVPVYNVNHAFGFFSVFNADAIKNVTLYKGSFPARFGGRLSSVVDITMKDGDNKKYHGDVSLGLISSKINIEGPILNENTTFNFSARRTYGDLLIKPLLAFASSASPDKVNAGYYFYDVNAKLSHKFSDKDRLYFSAYMGDDVIFVKTETNSFYLDNGARRSENIGLNWNWGNIVSALRWNHILSNKLFMNTTAAYTRYRFDMGVGMENITKGANVSNTDYSKLGYHSGIEDYSAKVDFDYAPNTNHDVKFGAAYTFHTFSPGVLWTKSRTTMDSTVQTTDISVGDKNVVSHETALYAEDNITVNYFLKANVGMHFSSFFVQDEFYKSLQPRLGLRFLVNDQLSFKAGYSYMKQYIHLLSNSSITLPTDLWVPVTKRIAPMESHQYSTGAFYSIPNIVELSVESYFKSMNNLIEYKDGSSFMGSSTGWEDKVNMGRGWAYGIEFLAQKTVGKTTGWVGYTWSKAERIFDRPGQEINFGEVFPAKYDRRHDVSIVVSHKLSKAIDFAATWVYSTGNCSTLALQNYAAANLNDNSGLSYYNNSLPQITHRNNYRFNDYHRLDLGVNFHKKKKYGIRTWNISVYNVYRQLNPFLVYPSSENGNPNLKQVTLFPIIPSVSYSYKF
jgi:hypothetical protein